MSFINLYIRTFGHQCSDRKIRICLVRSRHGANKLRAGRGGGGEVLRFEQQQREQSARGIPATMCARGITALW